MGNQISWRRCQKCEGFFFSGNQSQGACAGGGTHDASKGGFYEVSVGDGSKPVSIVLTGYTIPGTEGGWRWCKKCQGLFFTTNPSGVCPADHKAHDGSGSAHHELFVAHSYAYGQALWRRCNKCQVLFYSGNKTQGVCPSGGSHDANANKPYIALYDYLRFDTGEIAFDNGVSITGEYYGYMRPNGGYWFGGHFHNGLPIPYDVSAMMAVKSSSGKVFTFTHKLSLGGWGGDQDGSWSISGTNPAIASAWDDLKRDDHFAWDAQANCDFGVLWSDIKSAIGTITEVMGIVEAALA